MRLLWLVSKRSILKQKKSNRIKFGDQNDYSKHQSYKRLINLLYQPLMGKSTYFSIGGIIMAKIEQMLTSMEVSGMVEKNTCKFDERY